MSRIHLPYGSRPLALDVGDHQLVQHRPVDTPSIPAGRLCRTALDLPVHGVRLDRDVKPGDRVLIIVSDHTRNDPRRTLIRAIRERLPEVRLTIAIATGTHGPADLDTLDLGDVGDLPVVNHDCDDDRNLIELGRSRRGTPFRVNRCLAETDWIIATGCIRPHYFAGFGGGVKAIFPGLGGRKEIRTNHQLKTQSGARAGVVTDNPCRRDMEEILEHVPGRAYLLNLVVDSEDRPHQAVAGEVVGAFRHGAELSRPLHQVAAEATDLVVASATAPINTSLYQASKIVPAIAPLLSKDEAVIVLAVECAQGVGGVDVVNDAIYEIGLKPRLPERHTIFLVSGMPRAQVAETYCEYANSVDEVLAKFADRLPTIVPNAPELLVIPK